MFETVDRIKRAYGINVIDPSVVLCAKASASWRLRAKPLYMDDHHLSACSAKQLLPLLAPVFRSAQGDEQRIRYVC